MSASLVGSEMCIRDSQASSHPGRALEHLQLPQLPKHVVGDHDLVSALSPVSYTHLTLPTICSV
eukprot:2799884-Alexandrium_andersonii.AAC.1